MKEALEIANTILSQIKALDFWALGSWGSHGYTAEKTGPLADGAFKDEYIRGGGVTFKVKTPKYPTSTWVRVFLMGSDTYSIEIVNMRVNNYKTINSCQDVYCDQLVYVIDSLIENKR